jgi:hypothetical protein
MNDILQLKRINDKEPIQSDIPCINADSLAGIISYIISHLYIDNGPSIKLKGTIFQSDVPGPDDRDKIWVRTEFPYSVNYFIDGQYRSLYFNGWQINSPFLSDDIIQELNVPGLTLLSSTQLEKYGIVDTVADATERLRWFIYNPDPITV